MIKGALIQSTCYMDIVNEGNSLVCELVILTKEHYTKHSRVMVRAEGQIQMAQRELEHVLLVTWIPFIDLYDPHFLLATDIR